MRDVIYSFDTANLSVRACAEPEDIDAVVNGDVAWFSVVVEIKHKGTGAVLGGDALGGCAYRDTDEFVEGHRDPNPLHRNSSIYRAEHPNSFLCHYFPDMIRQACGAARASLRELRTFPVRENACQL